MAAVAHNPTFARKVGIPQSVGKDFSEADKGKKFNKGGEMKESKAMADAEMKALKRGHAPKRVLEHEKSEHKEMGYKHGGKIETAKTGFGMKKGGHVKHHEKHMKRGGVSAARMARPKSPVPPAALAAMMGAQGPMGAGPAGPAIAPPGMKHGGHVHHGHGGIHHHSHHHYYTGGHVGPGEPTTPGSERMIGPNKSRDGAAKKGHTKGKVR